MTYMEPSKKHKANVMASRLGSSMSQLCVYTSKICFWIYTKKGNNAGCQRTSSSAGGDWRLGERSKILNLEKVSAKIVIRRPPANIPRIARSSLMPRLGRRR